MFKSVEIYLLYHETFFSETL